jgi:hypothetical protein
MDAAEASHTDLTSPAAPDEVEGRFRRGLFSLEGPLGGPALDSERSRSRMTTKECVCGANFEGSGAAWLARMRLVVLDSPGGRELRLRRRILGECGGGGETSEDAGRLSTSGICLSALFGTDVPFGDDRRGRAGEESERSRDGRWSSMLGARASDGRETMARPEQLPDGVVGTASRDGGCFGRVATRGAIASRYRAPRRGRGA